ncbi:MAG: hypothetical protein WAN11_07750 [Syntrophobacteraceae bacterium]
MHITFGVAFSTIELYTAGIARKGQGSQPAAVPPLGDVPVVTIRLYAPKAQVIDGRGAPSAIPGVRYVQYIVVAVTETIERW